MSGIAEGARQPDVLFGELFGFLLEVLGLPFEKAEPDELKLSPEALAFAGKAYEVTGPAWRSLNVQSLRQTLGEIALSAEVASFFLGVVADGAADKGPMIEGPLQPHPLVVARLGKPTADLLTEALELGLGAMSGPTRARVLEELRSVALTPEAIAQTRHHLVLGDILPPRFAQKILASMRGEMALCMLLTAAAGTEKLRDWMGVTVGEIAVEGMKALPEILSTDLRAATEAHATFKAQAFERLEREPSAEDLEDDDEPNAT